MLGKPRSIAHVTNGFNKVDVMKQEQALMGWEMRKSGKMMREKLPHHVKNEEC
jgi:hypothetical protein